MPSRAIVMARRTVPVQEHRHESPQEEIASSTAAARGWLSYGRGDPAARLAFVTERGGGPDESELLEKMIQAMGLSPGQVWIAETGDTGPALAPGEALAFETVCALGAAPARAAEELAACGARVHATHSLSELARNPAAKRETWSVLQEIASELGIEIPRRGGR